MRNVALSVLFGLVVVTGGCGSTSPAGGTGGTGGGAGSGGGSAGSGAAGTVGSGGRGGSTGSAGTSGSGGAGGALACGTTTTSSGDTCNTVEATGPCVTATLNLGSAPVAGGGTISVGTYDLTSETVYASPDAGAAVANLTHRQTFVLSSPNGTSFTYNEVNLFGTATRRVSGTANVTGTGVVLTQTCPVTTADAGVNGQTAGFTVTPSASSTTLTLIQPAASGAKVVLVFTLRP